VPDSHTADVTIAEITSVEAYMYACKQIIYNTRKASADLFSLYRDPPEVKIID
jgi:hypothetical protein